MKPTRLIMALCVVAAAVFSLTGHDPAAQEQAPPKKDPGDARTLSDFMRMKLQASNQILEGLALENLDLVQGGAQTLSKMSVAEKWRRYNDATYRQYSVEFQRNTEELMKAAKENNLDQAALKWFSTTMSCIECHRFVRNNLVVEAGR